MSTLANTCEGTDGSNVPSTSAGAPNAFNTAGKTGTGATLTYDSAHAHLGSTSIKSHLPASVASTTQIDWSTLPSTPTANAFVRFYVYMTALPTANTRIAAFIGSAALRTSLQLQTNGFLRTLTSAGGTISTMAESFPLNQWVRVEFEISGISGTTGTVAARLFSGANLETSTPDSGANLSASSASIGGTVDDCRFASSSSTTVTVDWDCRYDDFAYSDASTPGPALATGTASVALPKPSLSGAGPKGVLVVVVGDMQPGAAVNPPPDVVAAQITSLDPEPDYILMPGDLANTGTSTQYGFFDTMYGSVMDRIYPVPGNHDWTPGDLSAYDADSQLGPRGHSPTHYYSFDTSNGWHVIGLESDAANVGAPSIGSDQYNWLLADLAANAGKRLIAFWHHPRWSDGTNTADPGGTGDSTVMEDVWNLLYDHHADLVLVGHCHSYQRFAKFGKTGSADAAGIREFVVGTGGSGLFTLTGPGRSEINSYQADSYDQLNSKWFGYLKLWLAPDSYSWQFVSQNAVDSEAPGLPLDAGGPIATNVAGGANVALPKPSLAGTGGETDAGTGSVALPKPSLHGSTHLVPGSAHGTLTVHKLHGTLN